MGRRSRAADGNRLTNDDRSRRHRRYAIAVGMVATAVRLGKARRHVAEIERTLLRYSGTNLEALASRE